MHVLRPQKKEMTSVLGGKLASGRWAHLKQADCPRTARLIIDKRYRFILRFGNWEWRAGKNEAAGRFFEPSFKEDKMTVSRAALSALTKTLFSKTPIVRSFLASAHWYDLQCQVIHPPTPNTHRRALSRMSSEICFFVNY